MEINLLPRKSFIEKRFFVLSITVLVLLLAVAYGFWYYYMQQQAKNLALQLEVQNKKLEQAVLLNNLGWNQEVAKYEEQVLQVRRYQLLADGLQITEVNWTAILAHIQSLLPSTDNIITIAMNGDTIHGKVRLNDVTAATHFIEQLRNYESLKDVFVESMESAEGNGAGYEITFSAYLNLLPF